MQDVVRDTAVPGTMSRIPKRGSAVVEGGAEMLNTILGVALRVIVLKLFGGLEIVHVQCMAEVGGKDVRSTSDALTVNVVESPSNGTKVANDDGK